MHKTNSRYFEGHEILNNSSHSRSKKLMYNWFYGVDEFENQFLDWMRKLE